MAHVINYTAESDGVDDSTATAVLSTVVSWEEGDPSHNFDGIAYDRVNDGMRISIRVTGVTNIDQRLSDLDDGVSSVNSSEGTSFPAPSDVADIRPE